MKGILPDCHVVDIWFKMSVIHSNMIFFQIKPKTQNMIFFDFASFKYTNIFIWTKTYSTLLGSTTSLLFAVRSLSSTLFINPNWYNYQRYNKELPCLARVFWFHWNVWNARISVRNAWNSCISLETHEMHAFHRSSLIVFSYQFPWYE